MRSNISKRARAAGDNDGWRGKIGGGETEDDFLGWSIAGVGMRDPTEDGVTTCLAAVSCGAMFEVVFLLAKRAMGGFFELGINSASSVDDNSITSFFENDCTFRLGPLDCSGFCVVVMRR